MLIYIIKVKYNTNLNMLQVKMTVPTCLADIANMKANPDNDKEACQNSRKELCILKETCKLRSLFFILLVRK